MSEIERAQFARNCKPGCPGPELMEAARGGHSCDVAIARVQLSDGLLPTARRLEDQLARVEQLARDLVASGFGTTEHEVAQQLLDILTGADVERDEALAALQAEPVQPS